MIYGRRSGRVVQGVGCDAADAGSIPGRGRHFSLGKSRCPENKFHQSPYPGMTDTYGRPLKIM